MVIELTMIHIAVMLMFVMACVYFNYRKGFKDGTIVGYEYAINVLAAMEIVELTYNDDGDLVVRPLESKK